MWGGGRGGLGSWVERLRDGCPMRILTMMRVRSLLSLAALTVCGVVGGVAQETGVSHPDEAVIEASGDAAPGEMAPVAVAKPAEAKPSAAVPTANAGAEGERAAYGAYVPYVGPKTGARSDAAMPATATMTDDEADGAVVTTVTDRPGELREGTLLQARIRERLSTAGTARETATEEGSAFTAELVTPVEKDGRVVLPIGTLVQGRVTSVHGGRRISGKAELHLEARSLLLPNGTRYVAHMQLIDTDQLNHTKIDSEGSLVRRDHPKETMATLGLAAGGGAAAGGVFGGPVGAGVGAGLGAGVGTVIWLKQDRQEVVPAHSLLVFSLSKAMSLTEMGETPAVAEAHAAKVSGNPDGMVVGADQ